MRLASTNTQLPSVRTLPPFTGKGEMDDALLASDHESTSLLHTHVQQRSSPQVQGRDVRFDTGSPPSAVLGETTATMDWATETRHAPRHMLGTCRGRPKNDGAPTTARMAQLSRDTGELFTALHVCAEGGARAEPYLQAITPDRSQKKPSPPCKGSAWWPDPRTCV